MRSKKSFQVVCQLTCCSFSSPTSSLPCLESPARSPSFSCRIQATSLTSLWLWSYQHLFSGWTIPPWPKLLSANISGWPGEGFQQPVSCGHCSSAPLPYGRGAAMAMMTKLAYFVSLTQILLLIYSLHMNIYHRVKSSWGQAVTKFLSIMEDLTPAPVPQVSRQQWML